MLNFKGKNFRKAICALLTGVVVVGLSPVEAKAKDDVVVDFQVQYCYELTKSTGFSANHEKGVETTIIVDKSVTNTFNSTSKFSGPYKPAMDAAAIRNGYVYTSSDTMRKGDTFKVDKAEASGRYSVIATCRGCSVSAHVEAGNKTLDASSISWMPSNTILYKVVH